MPMARFPPTIRFLTKRKESTALLGDGLRNPFTFAIRRSNGDMCINDIGSNKFEEINRGVPGGNYGWPLAEGTFGGSKICLAYPLVQSGFRLRRRFVPENSAWPKA